MILSTDRSKAQSSALAQTNFTAMILILYPHCKLRLTLSYDSTHAVAGMVGLDLAGTNPNFTAMPVLCLEAQSLQPITM